MNIQRLLLIGAVLLGTAVPAVAQIGFRVSFGGHHHGRSFQVSLGSGSYRAHHSHHSVQCVDTWVRVWVPGCERRVYVPARYGYRRDACGHRVRYCIAPAHYRLVREPGRWEYRRQSVVGR